jgi:hypothetical protein
MAILKTLEWVLGAASVPKTMRGATVVIVSFAYLSYVFRLFDAAPWHSGLGDWQDPYFINALLEHWYRSVTHLTNPASPGMYFPVRGTLSYSHGLVLFAPFYVPLRLFLHPFQAYTFTLLVALEIGMLCLYVLVRKLGLSTVEALASTALFASSQNVIHGETGVWSQRASVFLIPPILLLLVTSGRMRSGRARIVLGALGGFLATLMYVQDFYTAHFAFLFASVFATGFVMANCTALERIPVFWNSESRAAQSLLVLSAASLALACFVTLSGGGELWILGVRLRSHDWARPTFAALLGFLAFITVTGRARAIAQTAASRPWLLAACSGAAAGAAVFLWMYLGTYREHRSFPEENLLNALVFRDPSSWRTPLDLVRGLDGYRTQRSFLLVCVIGLLTWLPLFKVDKKTRWSCVFAVLVSAIVLLIPFRFPEGSMWRLLMEPLPGFGVIRDPKRIIQVYELAVVVALALFLRRLPPYSVARLSITLLMVVVLVAGRNPERFDYERPIDRYDRWVAAPIRIDPACKSFYIRGASSEYMSYGRDMWSLYSIDAMFVSLNQGIPTLNGYSAWFPAGWTLQNPQESSYLQRVKRWVEAHGLSGVCELDVDARVMTLLPDQRRR